VKLDKLAKDTESFSGADIAAVCNEAVMLSIREYVSNGGTDNAEKLKKNKISMNHFESAIEKLIPEKIGESIQQQSSAIKRLGGNSYTPSKVIPNGDEEEMYA